MLVIAKMECRKSRKQVEKDTASLVMIFAIAGVALTVFAFFLGLYKVPITVLGFTVGYDHPYAEVMYIVFPISLVILVVGCIVGAAYYYSSIRTAYSENPILEGKTFETPAQQGTIFCRYCGNEIKSDSVFCSACGRNQT
jgi:hypothetical protein